MGNPFACTMYGGIQAMTCDAADRVRMVKDFDRAQCLAALKTPELQKSVEKAIHVRLRKIEREAK